MTKKRVNLKKIRSLINYDSSKGTFWLTICLPSFYTVSRKARAFLRVNKVGLNIDKAIRSPYNLWKRYKN